MWDNTELTEREYFSTLIEARMAEACLDWEWLYHMIPDLCALSTYLSPDGLFWQLREYRIHITGEN